MASRGRTREPKVRMIVRKTEGVCSLYPLFIPSFLNPLLAFTSDEELFSD